MTEVETSLAELRTISLPQLCDSERFRCIDRVESYYRTTQDQAKTYDWDGRFQGYAGEADIQPGWVVPHKMRRPSVRYDLPRIIVKRITSLLFGTDRFPELSIEGDEKADDFVRELARASRLPARMVEARDLGGACGAVGMSFAFKRGRPLVEVHNAKHCTILDWEDKADRIVGSVLVAYSYPKRVMREGKVKTVDYYHVRYFNRTTEIIWDDFPVEVARTDWTLAPRRDVEHGFGFCPFYWLQNTPDSIRDEGEVDYEGLGDTFDELNRLLSATTKGTRSTVDPTLVMHADPALNDGVVKTGTSNVIWCAGGAEYLELKGQSQSAAANQIHMLRDISLESASVVLADPEKLSGAAQSAAALRLIYAPMLAAADIRREQYGERGVKALLGGMLKAAKKLLAVPPQVIGEGMDAKLAVPALDLEPRMVEDKLVPREPGERESITLNWNPYFSPTWKDIADATKAVVVANGNKPVLSQRSSVKAVQSLWGVKDVDAELELIEEDADAAVERMQESMAAGPDPFADDKAGNQDEPDDDEE